MINYVIFSLTAASLLFLILAIIYMLKQKVLENKKLISGINTLILGLFFLGLFLVAKHIEYADLAFELNWSFVNTLLNIANMIFLPLMAICFMVAIVIFKEI